MEPSDNLSGAPLTAHANLWLEANGQVALSRWRVQLLEAIAATGSIRAAAAQMKITYNLAWHRLDEMEQALGVQLVHRQRGGPGGGAAQLTEQGRAYVARFNRFAAEVDAVMARAFEAHFGS
jgi:molybdate transport system regulatory protein